MHEDFTAVPRFAPGFRLRFNPARERHVLLGPERVFVPDDTGLAVLRLIDGQRSISAIVAALATAYAAPADRIAADVAALLRQLTDRGAILWTPPETFSQASPEPASGEKNSPI